VQLKKERANVNNERNRTHAYKSFVKQIVARHRRHGRPGDPKQMETQVESSRQRTGYTGRD
jgi:hypothetical protein